MKKIILKIVKNVKLIDQHVLWMKTSSSPVNDNTTFFTLSCKPFVCLQQYYLWKLVHHSPSEFRTHNRLHYESPWVVTSEMLILSYKMIISKQKTKGSKRWLPMMLWACCDPRSMAAKPKSPILTCPRWPLTKMLSHLRSRCITGGSCPCR